eukprot:g933.t1
MHKTPEFKHKHDRERTLRQMRSSTGGRTYLYLQKKRFEAQAKEKRRNKTKTVTGVVDNFAVGAPWERDDGYLRPKKQNERDSAVSDATPEWFHIKGVKQEPGWRVHSHNPENIPKKPKDSSVSSDAPAWFHVNGVAQNGLPENAVMRRTGNGIDSAVSEESPDWWQIKGIQTHSEPKKHVGNRIGKDSAISRNTPYWMHVPHVSLRDIKRPGDRVFDPHDPAYVESHEQLQDHPHLKEEERLRATTWSRSNYAAKKIAATTRPPRSPKAAKRINAAREAASDQDVNAFDSDSIHRKVHALQQKLIAVQKETVLLESAAEAAQAHLAEVQMTKKEASQTFVDSCVHMGYLSEEDAKTRLLEIENVVEEELGSSRPIEEVIDLPPALTQFASIAKSVEQAKHDASRTAANKRHGMDELKRKQNETLKQWRQLKKTVVDRERNFREHFVSNAVSMGFMTAQEAEGRLLHARDCPVAELRKLPEAMANYARAYQDLRSLQDVTPGMEALLYDREKEGNVVVPNAYERQIVKRMMDADSSMTRKEAMNRIHKVKGGTSGERRKQDVSTMDMMNGHFNSHSTTVNSKDWKKAAQLMEEMVLQKMLGSRAAKKNNLMSLFGARAVLPKCDLDFRQFCEIVRDASKGRCGPDVARRFWPLLHPHHATDRCRVKTLR